MKKSRPILSAAALLLWTAPLLAGAGQPTWQEQPDLAQYRAAIEQMRSEMFRPGPRVAGWDRGGADPDADLRAMGADRFYFMSRGSSGRPQVNILTARPLAEFVPRSWQVVDSYGRAGETLRRPSLDFIRLSPRYVMGMRSSAIRSNDVDCASGISHALLFEVPGTSASPDDEMIPTMFRMIILGTEGITYCVRAEGNRQSGYRMRYFLPDGRSLPALDEGEEMLTIVPAAPLERLLSSTEG